MVFRKLRADEIEVRVASVKQTGVQVLLYKNARCDMNVLDETVGAFNWQRDHKDLKGNMYAGIGIWDADKNQWIWKWDCGTESNTEAEKGEASDSFKRAGFAWGIGRELYTAPFTWFKASDANIENGKCFDKFYVEFIEYDENRISYLRVVNKTTGKAFSYGKAKTQEGAEREKVDSIGDMKIAPLKAEALRERLNGADKEVLKANKISMNTICKKYNVSKLEDLTETQYREFAQFLVSVGVN